MAQGLVAAQLLTVVTGAFPEPCRAGRGQGGTDRGYRGCASSMEAMILSTSFARSVLVLIR